MVPVLEQAQREIASAIHDIDPTGGQQAKAHRLATTRFRLSYTRLLDEYAAWVEYDDSYLRDKFLDDPKQKMKVAKLCRCRGY